MREQIEELVSLAEATKLAQPEIPYLETVEVILLWFKEEFEKDNPDPAELEKTKSGLGYVVTSYRNLLESELGQRLGDFLSALDDFLSEANKQPD